MQAAPDVRQRFYAVFGRAPREEARIDRTDRGADDKIGSLSRPHEFTQNADLDRSETASSCEDESRAFAPHLTSSASWLWACAGHAARSARNSSSFDVTPV